MNSFIYFTNYLFIIIADLFQGANLAYIQVSLLMNSLSGLCPGKVLSVCPLHVYLSTDGLYENV